MLTREIFDDFPCELYSIVFQCLTVSMPFPFPVVSGIQNLPSPAPSSVARSSSPDPSF